MCCLPKWKCIGEQNSAVLQYTIPMNYQHSLFFNQLLLLWNNGLTTNPTVIYAIALFNIVVYFWYWLAEWIKVYCYIAILSLSFSSRSLSSTSNSEPWMNAIKKTCYTFIMKLLIAKKKEKRKPTNSWEFLVLEIELLLNIHIIEICALGWACL